MLWRSFISNYLHFFTMASEKKKNESRVDKGGTRNRTGFKQEHWGKMMIISKATKGAAMIALYMFEEFL